MKLSSNLYLIFKEDPNELVFLDKRREEILTLNEREIKELCSVVSKISQLVEEKS